MQKNIEGTKGFFSPGTIEVGLFFLLHLMPKLFCEIKEKKLKKFKKCFPVYLKLT